MNDDSVGKPQCRSRAKDEEHAKRKVFRGFALIGFDYLWNESDCGEGTGQKTQILNWLHTCA